MKGLSLLIWILIIFVALIIIFGVSFIILQNAQKFYKEQEYKLELFERAIKLKTRGFDINRLIMSNEERKNFTKKNFECWLFYSFYGYDQICGAMENNPYFIRYGNFTEKFKECISNAIVYEKPCILYDNLKINQGSSTLVYDPNYKVYYDKFLLDIWTAIRSIDTPIYYEKSGIKQFVCYLKPNIEYSTIYENDTNLFVNYKYFEPFIHGGYIDENFKNIFPDKNNITLIYQAELKLEALSNISSYTIIITDAKVEHDRNCSYNIYIFKNWQIANDTNSATYKLFDTIKNMPDEFFKRGSINLDVNLNNKGYQCNEIIAAINEGLWEWNRNHFYDKEYIKMIFNYGIYNKYKNSEQCKDLDSPDDFITIFFPISPFYGSSDIFNLNEFHTRFVKDPNYAIIENNKWNFEDNCTSFKKININIIMQESRILCINKNNEYGIVIEPKIIIKKLE